MPTADPDYSKTFQASGDINTSRFVMQSGDFAVAQATADARTCGVSQEGARDAPIPSASTLAAASGDSLKVYLEGAECLLEFGGTVTIGPVLAELASDAVGRGVQVTPAAGARENVGAIAQEAGVLGDKRRVIVVRDSLSGGIYSS